VRHSDAD